MAHFKSQLVPSLLARNLEQTIGFYCDILEFKHTGIFKETPGSEPVWAEVSRDNISIQFFTDPPVGLPKQPVMSGTLYFYPESVKELASELEGKIEFEWGPEPMEYGMFEFGIRDPNGYYLAFSEPV